METLLKEIEQKVLNKFGKLELTASQAYLHLSNRMKTLGYFGAEKMFMTESNGEREHYQKIEQFCNNLGGELSVEQLSAIQCDCQDLESALTMAYDMEKDLLLEYEKEASNTELSLKVVLLLQEFTTHQVTAVGEFSDFLSRIKLTNNMLSFDQELGN